MRWRKNVYLGELAQEKCPKLIRSLKNNKSMFGAYIITLAYSKRDLLDIIPSFMMYKETYADKEIIGVAYTKEEAYEVCQTIIEDVYSKTGGYDVRRYFS